jgi:integrase
LENVSSERAARRIERALTAVMKYKDFRHLDDESRRVCIQLFRNRGWDLPPALITSAGHQRSAEELTLIKAIDYCLSDPEVATLTDPTRHEQSFAHILAYWGPEFPIKDLKVRQIKEYMLKRMHDGASGSTINKERGALSKMFKVLIQAELMDRNPVKDTNPADERDGQRDVYISFDDFLKLTSELPPWAEAIFRTLYYTGMRRGEVLSLTWEDVNLESRIIRLNASKTKERRPKRVPIHKLLVPDFLKARKLRSLSGHVFLTAKGSSPHEDSLKLPWRKALDAVGLQPRPRIHDLRHTWLTNAMRSRLYPLIVDSIVGHGDRRKDVRSLYVTISDEDLVQEIDRMRFDLGETEIWVQK